MPPKNSRKSKWPNNFFLFISLIFVLPLYSSPKTDVVLIKYKHENISNFNSGRILSALIKFTKKKNINFIIQKKLPEIDYNIFEDFRTLDAGSILEDKFETAKNLYFNAKFQEAIPLLLECKRILVQKILEISTLKPYLDVLYFLGMTYYALGDEKNAHLYLKILLVVKPDYIINEDEITPPVAIKLKKLKNSLKKINMNKLKIKLNTDKAQILIDQNPIGHTDSKGEFDYDIIPAEHILEIKKYGFKYIQKMLTFYENPIILNPFLEKIEVEKLYEPSQILINEKKRLLKFLFNKLSAEHILIPILVFENENYYLKANLYSLRKKKEIVDKFYAVNLGNNLLNFSSGLEEFCDNFFTGNLKDH